MIEKSDVLELLAGRIANARSHEDEIKLRELMHEIYEIPERKAVPVKALLGERVFDVRRDGQGAGQIVERTVRGFQMTASGETVYCLVNVDDENDRSYVFGEEFWFDQNGARPTALKVRAEKQRYKRQYEERG